MKQLTGLVVCAAFLFSHFHLNADEGSSEVAELVIEGDPAPQEPPPEDPASAAKIEAEEDATIAPEDSPKYVKKASEEEESGKERVWVKYVVAAAAITVAVIALLLVKRDPGTPPSGS